MFAGLARYWESIRPGQDFHVHAVAGEPRLSAIPRAEQEVQRHGGDILDFKMFSDLSLNLLVELNGAGVGALIESLTAQGWHVEVEPTPDVLAARAANRLQGTFEVTFPEGHGDLVIRAPAVPG